MVLPVRDFCIWPATVLGKLFIAVPSVCSVEKEMLSTEDTEDTERYAVTSVCSVENDNKDNRDNQDKRRNATVKLMSTKKI